MADELKGEGCSASLPFNSPPVSSAAGRRSQLISVSNNRIAAEHRLSSAVTIAAARTSVSAICWLTSSPRVGASTYRPTPMLDPCHDPANYAASALQTLSLCTTPHRGLAHLHCPSVKSLVVV